MRKALIVDDQDANIYLLRSVLAASGYEVVAAGDGREALERAVADPPDIIISDILMPVMDGFTLCRQCRRDERLKSVPFVFYTATYTDPGDEQLALGAGADLFLVKPLEPEVFLERIADVVERCASGTLKVPATPELEEVEYLKEYSGALVRKLEDKVADVEEANRSLLVKEFAIESAPSGIALIDLAGRVTYANHAMAALAGRPRAALAGATLDEIFAGSAAWGEAVKWIARSGHWRGELSTGEPPNRKAVNGAVHTVVGRDGQPLCRMAAFEDVTEQARMAAEAQRGQRLASLSLFAAGVAHDFNNLLTGVFGNIELATASLPADHPARVHLDDAGVAFERARDLTRRLLTFAKGSPPVRRDVRAVDLLRECCALALAGSGVRVEIVSDPAAWPVIGDANQLSQVFTNILLNARQAMGDRGAVRLTVENQETPADAGPPSRYVQVTITDEGPGIPPEALARIFDPLFTTKPEGFGLGLATCYSIVQAHAGSIEAGAAPGGGARFRVLLPAGHEVAGGKTPADPASWTRPTRTARVLVMDDEALVRELASRMLRQGGYETATASNGGEALECCAAAELSGTPFDVVILDLTVPGGMGGCETMQRLRESRPHLPVIISTGYGYDAAGVEECRPSAVLPKPYQLHELLACVRAVTAEGRGEE